MDMPRISIPVDRISEESLLAAGLSPIDLIADHLDDVRAEYDEAIAVARRNCESLIHCRLKDMARELDDFRTVLSERRTT